MKNFVLAAFVVFICISSAFADEADERLSNMAIPELKASTSRMIRAGIDSEDSIRLTLTMLEYGFTQENVQRAQEIVMRSHDQGLPVGPVMNKAYEGMAKGIEQENIIRAMNNVMARYGFACQQAGELTRKEAQKKRIMEQIAECVAAGITEYDAERLVYHLKYRIQGMPKEEADGLAIETFRAVKDISRLRVSSMKATDLALEALKHHYGAQEMTRMRQSFMKHARDTSPNAVAEGYFNAIQLGNRLENLDFLSVKGTGKSGGKGSSVGSGGGSTGTGSGGSHGGGSGSNGRGSGGSKGGR